MLLSCLQLPRSRRNTKCEHPKAARKLESIVGSPRKGTGIISSHQLYLVLAVILDVQLNCCTGEIPCQTGHQKSLLLSILLPILP